MRDMDTGQPLSTIRDRILSANAYIGAFPLAEALDTGADVVDRGPLHRHRAHARAHGPQVRLEARRLGQTRRGTIAGHIIECGAQCSGGNCQVDWEHIPDMADVGYPIVEAEPDGSFVVTKHPGAGGRVHSDTVKEQLLYELGDPKSYITPDCIADFTTIQLARHRPRPRRASAASAAARVPKPSSSRSATRTAGRPSARSSIAGRKPSRKPRPPTASCANGSPHSASTSMKSTLSSSA